MSDSQISLRPENYCHIFNRANGDENLFDSESDYFYFLEKLKKYILPVSDLLAYCLMPNHFHMVVRIKSKVDIDLVRNAESKRKPGMDKVLRSDEDYLSGWLSQVYSNFFNTYAKHYNFRKSRKGSLFKRAFRRKIIQDMDYLRKLICYVHQNPVEAGFTASPLEWKYSSYRAIIGSKPTLIPKDEIIDLFGDVENLVFCHAKQVKMETV